MQMVCSYRIFPLCVKSDAFAWRPSLLPAAMTRVFLFRAPCSFSPPGSLLPITYSSLGRLGVRGPGGNL